MCLSQSKQTRRHPHLALHNPHSFDSRLLHPALPSTQMPPVRGVPLLRLRLGPFPSQPGDLLRTPATLLRLLLPPPSSSPAGGGGSAPEYCLQCLYCQWTSEALGLVASEPAALTKAVAAGEKLRDGDLKAVDALLAGMKRTEDFRVTGGGGGSGGAGGRSRTGSAVSGGGGGGGGGRGAGAEGWLPATPANATGPWKVKGVVSESNCRANI